MASIMQTGAARAAWDDARDGILIDQLLLQVRAGKRADSGFKKEAWVVVTAECNKRFRSELSSAQIKTRYQTLKAKYGMVKSMLGASGFGWDSERNVVLVHDSVWTEYAKSHPKAVDFRYRPLPYYDELVELFEGTLATGSHALSSRDPAPEQAARPNQDGQETAEASPAPPNETSSDTTPAARSSRKGQRAAAPTSEEPSKKRDSSGGGRIADAISEVASEMKRRTLKKARLTASQRAVQILQDTYKESLPSSALVQAFNIMLDETKASIFVVMENGELRDNWLDDQIENFH